VCFEGLMIFEILLEQIILILGRFSVQRGDVAILFHKTRRNINSSVLVFKESFD